MSANQVAFAPRLTFVSTTGPTLDHDSAKARRAHTTRANFARRRQRLVSEYAAQKQKEHHTSLTPLQADEHAVQAVRCSQLPFLSHPGLDRILRGNDAFFINHSSDAVLAMMQSDWAGFLPDPTMFEVSLYFARQFYAARRQQHTHRSMVDAYKGGAIRAVRQRLNEGLDGLSDSLIAAILILTVLDVRPAYLE
ncbi:hypothetical protein LTS17_004747 [Exophiala oligosperma]